MVRISGPGIPRSTYKIGICLSRIYLLYNYIDIFIRPNSVYLFFLTLETTYDDPEFGEILPHARSSNSVCEALVMS